MVEKHPEHAHEKTTLDTVSDVANIATIPVALGAGAYVFNAKTSDALYRLVKDKPELAGVRAAVHGFRGAAHGAETASKLGGLHTEWTQKYNEAIGEMGFTNVFKRFGGLHPSQRLAVAVESVTAVGLVVGFWALLEQLKTPKKSEADKTLSV